MAVTYLGLVALLVVLVGVVLAQELLPAQGLVQLTREAAAVER